MAKPQPIRVENAVKALFEYSRRVEKNFNSSLGLAAGEMLDHFEMDGLCGIALDLLGVPEDNATEFMQEMAAGTYPSPEYYCRDSFFHLWHHEAGTAREFINYCRIAIRKWAEENQE